MQTVGIVAEYNPFHTGHKYHIAKAKEVSGADFAVIVMSPDFVQRGEPAIFDKYTRTHMALLGGADLVLELPVCYATGSAEYFSEGAAALLDRLGVINSLCFGSETADADAFGKAADILLEEPEGYTQHLKEALKHGKTFPQARSIALAAYSSASGYIPIDTPNNILGVEYCKALKKMQSKIRPFPVERKGSAYSSSSLDGAYCSATALRRGIFSQSSEKKLLSYIPETSHIPFLNARDMCLAADDLLPHLTWQLLRCTAFEDVLDISSDLSDRISNLRFACVGKSYAEIVSLLKTKQMTEARIRRALLHLILGITRDTVEAFRTHGTVFYARILGFRKTATPLLHELKQKSTLPLITKTSCASSVLEQYGAQMWEQDLFASHLYRSIRAGKYHIPFQTEFEISPVIL